VDILIIISECDSSVLLTKSPVKSSAIPPLHRSTFFSTSTRSNRSFVVSSRRLPSHQSAPFRILESNPCGSSASRFHRLRKSTSVRCQHVCVRVQSRTSRRCASACAPFESPLSLSRSVRILGRSIPRSRKSTSQVPARVRRLYG
jgi:hypothetical protein